MVPARRRLRNLRARCQLRSAAYGARRRRAARRGPRGRRPRCPVRRSGRALGAGARIAAGEDTDMFWRMLRGGWAGCYDPRPSVVHVQWRDRRGYLRVSYNYGLGGAAVGVKRARFEHRPVLRAVLAESGWRNGVLQAWRDVRAGYEPGAIASLWRAAGGVVGTVVAARLPMRDDCFAGPVLAPRRD